MGNIRSFKCDIACLGRQQPRDRVKRRRLSGSVGTDQRYHIALFYLKGNSLECLYHTIIYL